MSIMDEFFKKVKKANEDVEAERPKQKAIKERHDSRIDEPSSGNLEFKKLYERKFKPIVDKLVSMPVKNGLKFISEENIQFRNVIRIGQCVDGIGPEELEDRSLRSRRTDSWYSTPSIEFIFHGYKYAKFGEGQSVVRADGLLDEKQYDAHIQVNFLGVRNGRMENHVRNASGEDMYAPVSLKSREIRNTEEMMDCLVDWLKVYAPDRLPELLQDSKPLPSPNPLKPKL